MNIRPLRQSSVRPSPIFYAIVAITAAAGVLAWFVPITPGERWPVLAYVGVFTFVVFGWLVSLCLHEFGHAYSAWKFGDRDVEVRGYLTLNPLKYSNPLLSLGLPVLFIALGGIGLPGGAVYVRTRWMTKRQRTTVSLAGPFANVVLAVLLLVTTAVFADSAHYVFWAAMAFLGFLQVTAVLLNLLPIPGLDGYGALEPHLSQDTQRSLEPVKQWGFLILLLLLFAPLLNQWFFGVVFWFVELFGVPSELAQVGGGLTRFWSAWF
ncbi:MAG: site-2 protease family protein [Mycobacterium sp.]